MTTIIRETRIFRQPTATPSIAAAVVTQLLEGSKVVELSLPKTLAKLKPIFDYGIHHPFKFLIGAIGHLLYLIFSQLSKLVSFLFFSVILPLLMLPLRPFIFLTESPLARYIVTALLIGSILGLILGYSSNAATDYVMNLLEGIESKIEKKSGFKLGIATSQQRGEDKTRDRNSNDSKAGSKLGEMKFGERSGVLNKFYKETNLKLPNLLERGASLLRARNGNDAAGKRVEKGAGINSKNFQSQKENLVNRF